MRMIPQSNYFELIEAGEGVYAAIVAEGQGAVGNAGFVNLGDSVLVFDTFNTQHASADLRDAATALTGLPIRYVANSHWHGDHVRGNQAFRDASIVSTSRTRELCRTIGAERLAGQKNDLSGLRDHIASVARELEQADESSRQALRLQLSVLQEAERSIPGLEVVLPDVTFEDRIAFHGTKRSVELRCLGGGHTESDSVLYVPDARVLFAADLITIGTHPLLIWGNPMSWLEMLEALKAYDAETIIPGHGPIGGRASIDTIQTYIRDIMALGASLRESGFDATQVSEQHMPEAYRDWKAPGMFPNNVKFVIERS